MFPAFHLTLPYLPAVWTVSPTRTAQCPLTRIYISPVGYLTPRVFSCRIASGRRVDDVAMTVTSLSDSLLHPCRIFAYGSCSHTSRVCDIRACGVRVCDVRVCDVRFCDVRVCDVRFCDVRVCDVGACDVKTCGIRACDVRIARGRCCCSFIAVTRGSETGQLSTTSRALGAFTDGPAGVVESVMVSGLV